MLNIQHLTIRTRHPILTDFSYDFKEGNLYGIVATNGSGKTTFFRSIMGLLPILSGKVELESGSAFYYETSDWLDSDLSGLDYLRFVQKEWRSQVKLTEVIATWKMEDYIHLPIRKYSLGMKQRLLIAMYMVSDSQCLLMDEMTNGLDEESRQIFFSILKGFKEAGKLVILSSHYKEDIEAYCDYLLTLRDEKMEVSAL